MNTRTNGANKCYCICIYIYIIYYLWCWLVVGLFVCLFFLFACLFVCCCFCVHVWLWSWINRWYHYTIIGIHIQTMPFWVTVRVIMGCWRATIVTISMITEVYLLLLLLISFLFLSVSTKFSHWLSVADCLVNIFNCHRVQIKSGWLTERDRDR